MKVKHEAETKYRKVIGWLLFALGIPFALVAVTVSKQVKGYFSSISIIYSGIDKPTKEG